MQRTNLILRQHQVLVGALCVIGGLSSLIESGHLPQGLPFSRLLPLVLAFVAAEILLLLVYFGFYRSAYEGKRYSLGATVRVGAHFFWRQIGVGFLGAMAFVLPLLLITWGLTAAGIFVRHPWALPVLVLATLGVILLLIFKYVVLAPGIILVLDCRMFTAFRLVKLVPLSKAGSFWGLFVLLIVWAIIAGLAESALGHLGWSLAAGGAQFLHGGVATLLSLLMNLEIMQHVVRYGISEERMEELMLFLLSSRALPPTPPVDRW